MPERTENIMNDFYGLEKLIEDNGGIENFRCFTQMGKIEIVTPFGLCMVSGDKETWTECKIDESRYKVSDGYKITVANVYIQSLLSERFYEPYEKWMDYCKNE